MARKPQENRSQGWIKLHRRILQSQVFSHPGILHLWIYCLVKANHKAKVWTPVHRNVLPVKIKRGQFITGRQALLEEVYPNPKKRPVSAKTLFRWLRFLEKDGNVSLKVSNRFTLVTVCNYNTYQNEVGDNVQPFVQQVSSKCPTHVQQVSTNKNVKNVKNEEEEREATPQTPTRTYLDFVQLSDKDHKKLLDRFGQDKTNEWISELNDAIGSKGYVYKSHYFTILAWDRKAQKEAGNGEESIEEQLDRITRKK